LAAFFLGQGLGLAEADANAFLRRWHVWGRFRPGSWVVVRQVVETLDPNGKILTTNRTETRTTLAGVEDRCLTLRVQASLEIGDKKLDGPPQEVRQGPHGERPDLPVEITVVGHEDVVLQGRTFPCQVEQSEATADGKRTVTRVWTSPEAEPFNLRRQTTVFDVQSAKVLEETTVDVVTLSHERRILARSRPVAEIRIVHRHPRGSTTAQAVNCPEVPGGLVSQSAEEFDADGKLLRRTKIELIDFESK
jgi:hypothetical protein